MNVKDTIELEFQTWLNQMYLKYSITRFDISLYVAAFIARQIPSHVSIKKVSSKS